MAMIPENPVVGGTVLERQSIRSPNFVTGSAGWSINQDGSAEFNNGTFRGIVTIGGSLFIYNGVPGAGNPPIMFAVKPGTTKDPFNNNLTTNPNASAVFGAGTVGAGQIIGDSTGTLSLDNGVTVGALPQLKPDTTASLLLLGGQHTAGDQQTWLLDLAKADSGQAVAQLVLGRAGARPVPATTALLEAQDPVAISSAAAGGLVLQVTSTTGGITGALALLTTQAAGDIFLGLKIAGDTNRRITLDTDGTGLSRILFGPGNAVADIILKRLSANRLGIQSADLAVQTVGKGLQVAEGTNAKQGTAVLVGGVKVVATTAVTANSRIFLTSQVDGGTPNFLRVSTRTPGVSFTIQSGGASDTSTVAWEIFEPGQ